MDLSRKMDDAVAHLIDCTAQGRPAYTVVPSSGKALLDEVFEGWERLVNEPLEYKRSWLFDIRQVAKSEEPDPDHGLIIRMGDQDPNSKEPTDNKHFFMFRPHFTDMLEYRFLTAEPKIDFDRYKGWLDALKRMHDAQMVTARGVADALDRRFPGLGFRAEIERCRNLHVVRLLHYGTPTKDPSGLEVIAKLHTDRDAYTVHVGENYPGLCDAQGNVITFRDDESGLFGGRKLQVAMGGKMVNRVGRKPAMQGGDIAALEHAVKETKGRNDSRKSCVFFVHTTHSIH